MIISIPFRIDTVIWKLFIINNAINATSSKKIRFDNFDPWIVSRVIIFIFFTSNIYIKGCWMVNATTSFGDVRTDKNCFIYFFLFLIRFFRRNINLANMFSIVNGIVSRSEEHTSELQSRGHLVCRLLLEKKK